MTQKDTSTLKQSDVTDVPKRIFIYVAVTALLVQVLLGLAIYLLLHKWDERAYFGEMFGAVNTLFSGLALAGVVYAIFLQRRDLELQRRELEITKEDLKRAALAQKKSEQSLVEQAKMMELTAKLTALNFLAGAYRNRIELLEKQGRESQQERSKWNEIILRLEDLTHQLEN